jgi:hypothetical protein
MRIADLTKKKNAKVTVRVPAKLQDQLGTTTLGTVEGVSMAGNITWVKVKVPRKGSFKFRPQDLAAA